ncbi:MAG: aldo/keto reductase [Thermoleophilia bacterium]|nr:aldo/keto reductase [Thermoleophilia bacterium]
MPLRELGRDGPMVGAIGFGCLSLSGYYGGGALDETAAIRLIHGAIDLGVTLLDTADMYGMGDNERVLGKAIAHRRDAVFVATKFGNILDSTGKIIGISGRPDFVRRSCEQSLRRLGIEAIDLYQQHRIDRETPIEETVGAMQELVDEGKVRFIGVGEARPSDLRRAVATATITTLQSEYSLFVRAPESDDVLSVCEELGVGFLAYAPLGRGLLAGRFPGPDEFVEGDSRAKGLYPWLTGDDLEHNRALVHELGNVAAELGATTAQASLAWLLSEREWIVPIPGTRHAEYVEQNISAAFLELPESSRRRLDALGRNALGDRYNAHHMPTWTSSPSESSPPPAPEARRHV